MAAARRLIESEKREREFGGRERRLARLRLGGFEWLSLNLSVGDMVLD